MIFRRFVPPTLLILFALTIHPANASFIITATIGGSAEAGSNLVNFDDLQLGTSTITTSGMTVSFAGKADGIVSSTYAGHSAPWVTADEMTAFSPSTLAASGADPTKYVSTGLGTVTMTFAFPERYFGLLWGSVDPTNTLSFYDAQGDLLDTVTSADFFMVPSKVASNGTYYVGVSADEDFTTVVASNTKLAFEFDNVAYANPVVTKPRSSGIPVGEASTMATMLAALLAMGFVRRRSDPDRGLVAS